eukprot:scaffold6969_cov122-Isochrysis_galbana.AAC.4
MAEPTMALRANAKGHSTIPWQTIALVLAHDARTKQLLANSRGEPPPSLNAYQARGYPPSPHLTKRLNSSSPIHSTTISPNTTSHNTQSTDHNQTSQLKPNAFVNDTPNGSRKRDQLKKNTGANAPWGHSGNLKEGTSPEARGGQRWRPDSSCWSWRRSIWPRKRAQSESALTAQTKAQPRCDCHSERLPASPPCLATISAGIA